jgi:hypothetical protein
MFPRKLLSVITTFGILCLPLSVSATKVLIRTDCLHPTQGEGVCEIELPNPSDSEIWDIVWQDKTKTRIKFSKQTDPENTPIRIWSSQSNQWVNSYIMGICFDRKCFHFPYAELAKSKRKNSRIKIECSSPTLFQGTCQIEDVPSTSGNRVYWPDGSIEHYRGFFKENELFSKWSHAKNGWIKVSSLGFCVDKSCLLIDANTFNQWRNK